jgi:hypothetical protein
VTAPMMPPHGALAQPPAPLQPPVMPWTPFAPLPMDDEPSVALVRRRRLGHLMATTEFSAQPLEWREVVQQAYTTARQAVAASQGAQAALPNTKAAGAAASAAQGPAKSPAQQVPTTLTA